MQILLGQISGLDSRSIGTMKKFQDHVNLRVKCAGPVVHQPVYIVQLACLEHAESIRRRCAFPLPCRRIHMCPVLFLKPAQRGISKTCLNLVRYLSRFWTQDSFQQLCALGVATGMIKGSFPMFMRNSATQNIYASCFP